MIRFTNFALETVNQIEATIERWVAWKDKRDSQKLAFMKTQCDYDEEITALAIQKIHRKTAICDVKTSLTKAKLSKFGGSHDKL